MAVALVFPPAVASAAATPPSPSQGAVSQPRPNVPDARQKTTPGAAAPSNPGPQQSAPSNSAPPPAAPPKPVQRKDKPPDRGAHKASPQHRASAAQRPNRHRNNNRKDTSRTSTSRKDTSSTDSRPAAGGAGSGGPQEAIAGVINGINNILNRLAGQDRTRTGKASPDRQRTRKQRRCERSGAGCLVVDPTPKKKPKSKKPRPRVNKLDNPDVVDKAEEELRKWREANQQGQQDLRQKYADAYNGPGSAIVDWCARFVTYAYAQAGFPLPDWQADAWDKSPTGFQLVRAGRDAAREAGLYHEGTAGIEPGDIVIYNGVNHTGIAVSGVKPDGTIDTIEGNTGNSEIDRQTPSADVGGQPGSGDIEGYIRPPANTTPMAPRFGNRHGNPIQGGR